MVTKTTHYEIYQLIPITCNFKFISEINFISKKTPLFHFSLTEKLSEFTIRFFACFLIAFMTRKNDRDHRDCVISFAHIYTLENNSLKLAHKQKLKNPTIVNKYFPFANYLQSNVDRKLL